MRRWIQGRVWGSQRPASAGPLRRRGRGLRARSGIRLDRWLLELEWKPLGLGEWTLGRAAASPRRLGGRPLGAQWRRLALSPRTLALASAAFDLTIVMDA